VRGAPGHGLVRQRAVRDLNTRVQRRLERHVVTALKRDPRHHGAGRQVFGATQMADDCHLGDLDRGQGERKTARIPVVAVGAARGEIERAAAPAPPLGLERRSLLQVVGAHDDPPDGEQVEPHVARCQYLVGD
jgi:hypothetical protein